MRAKILIVDDSPTSLTWHAMALKAGPYDVATATDGEAGVAAAIALRPDLILMDVEMPKMNGIEACREIRATPGLEDVPIVMVSTASELKTVEAATQSGCTDFVKKPADRTVLLAKVESCLAARRGAVAR